MRKNVGSNDRWIRILIGSALIFWVLFANGSIWGWLGVVPLVSGIFRYMDFPYFRRRFLTSNL